MAYRKKEDQQKAWREHYARNKEYYADRNKKRKAELRVWLESLKVGKTCSECGNSYPPKALDWHHRNPSEKVFQIGNAVNRGYSKKKILQEIEKCDIMCAICHRIYDPGHSVLVSEHSL